MVAIVNRSADLGGGRDRFALLLEGGGDDRAAVEERGEASLCSRAPRSSGRTGHCLGLSSCRRCRWCRWWLQAASDFLWLSMKIPRGWSRTVLGAAKCAAKVIIRVNVCLHGPVQGQRRYNNA